MRQYFIEKPLAINQVVEFDEEISHHIRHVLRMKNGDKVRIVDTNSQVFLATLVVDEVCKGIIEEEVDINTNNQEIIYIASLIKKDKWEMLLQKAAELGASKIVPLVTSRTIIHLEEKEIEKKLERWNKIVLQACQQCNRTSLCSVERPIKLKEANKYLSDINIVAYENETSQYVGNVLENKNITFIVGPEGGFALDEVEYLTSIGYQSCSLGERILRAETAGMYILCLIDGKRNSL